MITLHSFLRKLSCMLTLVLLMIGISEVPLFAQNSCMDSLTSCQSGANCDEQECIAGLGPHPTAAARKTCTALYTKEDNACYAAYNACIAPPPGVQGYINPKYVVVGVTYAPPGHSSYVTYTNSKGIAG